VVSPGLKKVSSRIDVRRETSVASKACGSTARTGEVAVRPTNGNQSADRDRIRWTVGNTRPNLGWDAGQPLAERPASQDDAAPSVPAARAGARCNPICHTLPSVPRLPGIEILRCTPD
jgi:hypothetical protein